MKILSAAKEQENYALSIQYSIEKTKASLQELANDILSSKSLKSLIDFADKLINVIDEITEVVGGPSILGFGLVLRSLILNFDKLGSALQRISKFKGIKSLLDIFKGAKQAGDTIEKVGKAAEKTASSTVKAAGDVIEFTGDVASTMGKVGAEGAKTMGNMAEAAGGAAEAAGDLTTAMGKAGSGAAGLGGVIGKLASTLGVSTTAVVAFGVALAAIAAGAVIWDLTTTTVKETEEEIEKTTARMNELNAEIEELNNLQSLTPAQYDRLAYLQKELDLQEQILEIEKKRRLEEKYENGFADNFDPDNAYRQFQVDDLNRGYDETKDLGFKGMSLTEMNLYEVTREYKELQAGIDDTTKDANELKKVTEDIQQKEQEAEDLLLAAYKENLDYQQKIAEAKEARDSGLLDKDSEAYKNADEMIQTYSKWIKANKAAIKELEKALGKDTSKYNAEAFEGIFKKVEYKDLKEELVDLAKKGGLSADVLTSKYSGLVTELDEAGYSAQELINYLKHLADPDMELRRETATELANSLNIDSPRMVKYAIKDLQNYFKENPEALKIASEIDFDISTWSLEDLKAYIEEELGNIEVEPKLTIDIDKQKKGIEALKEALSSNESLSKELVEEITEYFSQLEDFDASKLFIETSQGIRLNTEEVSRLRGELDNVNFTAIATELDNVEREYEETVEAMSHMNKASDEYAQKKADLYALQDRAKAAHQAAIEYSTLTSALKEFNDALATPKPSDDYASIVNQFDNIKKLADAKKFGLDEVKKYLQFFSYEDVDGKSVEELEKIYEDLYKVLEGTNIKKIDLLTVDDEGNATLEGISNFAKAINQRWGDAYTEFENGMWKFHLEGDKLDEVLKWGGLSTEFFESLLKVPEDWGYTVLKKIVPVSEAIQMLEIDANDAKEKLQQLGYVDIGFNLEDSTIGELNGIIQTLKIFTDNNKNEDGDININADGVREAIVLMNDLILRKQELEAQSIDVMHVDLDSSKMDEGLRNTIGIVQQLETDLQNLEKVKLLDGSDEEVEEAKQKIIDGLSALGDEDLSQYVQQLNLSDLVNIDAENLDASIKDIKDKIASISTEQLDGEIVVKATAETNEITDGVKQATDEASQNVITVNTEVNDEPVKSFIDYVDTAQPFVHVSADLTKANTDIKNFLDQPRSITVQVSAQKAPGNLSSAIGLKGVSKARGGAMASGGKTLVGELGQEMVVDPNRGIYETVGDNGAEFVNLPKGAIVFNHLQTKNLLKGKNPGRGTALVKGNAMETGYTPSSSSGKSDLTYTYRVIPDGDAGFPDFSHMQKSLNGVSKSAKDAAKSVKNMGESVKDAAKDVSDAEDQLSKLSSELDDIQSAWKKLDDIQKSYAETGKITVDQAQELINTDYRYLAMLNMEGDAMTVNQAAFETLTEAKLNEMKITLIRNAIDLVNTFQDEAVAAEYVANSYLNMGSAAAQATAQVQALQAAVAGLQATGSATQAQAAGLVMQGTMNALSMLNHVDMSTGLGASSVSSAGSSADPEDSAEEIEDAIDDQTEEVKNLFNWVDRLLERLNRNTEKWMKRADRFISWWRKNAATDKAIKKTRKEAKETQKAYIYYQAQARASDLDPELKKKVEKGGILIENIDNDELSEKIRDYQTWIEKIEECEDALQELYDQEKELIYQKLDNIVEYYDRIREYFDTMASKLTSRIDVTEAWGKQKSIGDLFDLIGLSIQKQKISDDEIFALQTGVAKEDFRPSEEVQEDLNKTRTNISDTGIRESRELERQALEENREYYQSLLDQKAQIKQAIKESTDAAEKKALRKQLKEIKKKIRENKPTKGQERLYGMDNNIIGALGNMGEGSDYYNKAVEKNNKLQAKQDEYDRIQAKILEKQAQLKEATSKEERKRLKKEIKELNKQAKQYKLSRKQNKVLKATGEQIEAMNELQDNIYVDFEVANSELYQGLLARIGELQSKDKLTPEEQTELAMKLDMLNAINHGVTIDNLNNYMKVYSRWWELNNKKNLTAGERLELESLSKKKEQFENNFVEFVQGLTEELDGSLMAEGKIPVDPEKAFREEQEYWIKWRDEQLKNNQEGYKDTPKYREWKEKLAADESTIAKFEKIKAIPKKLRTQAQQNWFKANKDNMDAVYEEADMINRMFEALEKGGTAKNIVDFIDTFLKNEQANKKLKNGKLYSKNGENDWSAIATTTQLALEDWYNKKSEEVDRIETEFQEQIDESKKRRDEAIANGTAASNEALVEIAGYVKQVIEYEIDSVQAAVDGLGAMVDRYKSVVDLLQTTSLENLKKYGVMDLFDLDDDKTLEELLTEKITGAIEASESKISESLAAIDMYTELAGAFEKSDFTDIMSKYYDKLDDEQKQWVDEAIKYLNENEDASSTWLTEINTRLADVINGVKDSIEDVKALKEAFREQVIFKTVNKAIEDLDKLNSHLDAATSLIKDDWTVIGGEITEYGKGKLALLDRQIQNAQKSVDEYRQKYLSAQQAWLDGAYDTEEEYRADLQKISEDEMAEMSKVQAYTEQVWQIAKKAQEAEINNLKKVAQARVDALKKKKEYYDYDKTLKNKTKDVEALQAQLDALSNINTAESKAQRAKLEESLANAQEDLDDTLKNHEFDLQTDALEKYISDLDDILNKANENLKETLEEYFNTVSNALISSRGTDPNEVLKDIYGGYMGNRDYTPIPVTLSTDDVPVISKRDVFRSKYSDNTITSSSDELLDYDHNNLDDQVKIAREIEELEKKYKEAFNYIPISQDDYLKSLNAKISNITSFMQSMPNGIPNSMYNDYNSLIRELAEATNTSNNVNVNIHYDSLMTVTGSVDATVVKDLEKLSKDIVIQTKKSLADDLRKLGVARTY